jgi:hypothetical protein
VNDRPKRRIEESATCRGQPFKTPVVVADLVYLLPRISPFVKLTRPAPVVVPGRVSRRQPWAQIELACFGPSLARFPAVLAAWPTHGKIPFDSGNRRKVYCRKKELAVSVWRSQPRKHQPGAQSFTSRAKRFASRVDSRIRVSIAEVPE